MLYYNRIDISEGTDPIKSNRSKFPLLVFNDGFKLQDFVCNGCHDWATSSVNTSNIAIITVTNVDYCCIILNISKSEILNTLKGYVLEDRGYT